MLDDLKLNKFMKNWDSYWGTGETSRTENVKKIVSIYLEAGSVHVDKPASVENVVAFLNSAVSAYWTKGNMSANEAIDSWSDALIAPSTLDPKSNVVSLMCNVYQIMREYSPSAMTAIYRLTNQVWHPEMTVWDLMCEVPIFF
jgi:hypothetical protein